MTKLIFASLLSALAAWVPAKATAQSQDWLPAPAVRGALSGVSWMDRVQSPSNYNVAVDTAAAPVRVQLLTVDPTTNAIEAYTTELDFTRLPTFHADEGVALDESQDWEGIEFERGIEDGCLRDFWVVYCGYQLAGQDWITLFHGDGTVSSYLLPAPDYRSFTVHHSTGTWWQTEAQQRNADARFRAMYEELQSFLN